MVGRRPTHRLWLTIQSQWGRQIFLLAQDPAIASSKNLARVDFNNGVGGRRTLSRTHRVGFATGPLFGHFVPRRIAEITNNDNSSADKA